ncbi:MAG: response regulator transcription factor [Acidobacteria bacterium]|nr:response regulator transcription factor [Acidobacteriota bacterium]
MVRILVVDDHPIVRRGFVGMLAEEFPAAHIGEAGDAGTALESVHKENWDLVVLDISLPGRSGLDVLREIKAARPHTPLLVLSMHPEEQFAVRAFKAGAAGYLTKDAASLALVEAVRKILKGGKYITPSLAEKLATDLGAGGSGPPHEALSDREYEVLRLIASGRTVGQIAEQLRLSVKTISTYRARLLEKMRMKTNAELTHYAISNKLVE